jgi:hypothetical protein
MNPSGLNRGRPDSETKRDRDWTRAGAPVQGVMPHQMVLETIRTKAKRPGPAVRAFVWGQFGSTRVLLSVILAIQRFSRARLLKSQGTQWTRAV